MFDHAIDRNKYVHVPLLFIKKLLFMYDTLLEKSFYVEDNVCAFFYFRDQKIVVTKGMSTTSENI